MIYEFEIRECMKTIVPVRAHDPDEAQRIFDEWYSRHDDDPYDSTIEDLLNNGHEGRRISRRIGQSERNYNLSKVMLPEEKSRPEEPKYDLNIRFADGSKSLWFTGETIWQISSRLATFGNRYYLFPDPAECGLITCESKESGYNACFWIYAVLKDQEETWSDLDMDMPDIFQTRKGDEGICQNTKN